MTAGKVDLGREKGRGKGEQRQTGKDSRAARQGGWGHDGALDDTGRLLQSSATAETRTETGVVAGTVAGPAARPPAYHLRLRHGLRALLK
jgi:hypothetical protein